MASKGALGPRERLALHGAEVLSDAELVCVLLGTGCADEPVAVLAERLLHDAGGLQALARSSPRELAARRGVGTSKAARLLAAVELGRRLGAVRLSPERPLSSSRDVDRALRPRLAVAEREHFVAVALDSKNRPILQLDIAIGGLAACALTPADVFRPLLRHAAASAVFAHNHPSGECAPSDQDIAMTERLARTGELVGVAVLDHLIVGREGYFSFLDAGLLRARGAHGSDRPSG
jgi:DNA repair protein RadC